MLDNFKTFIMRGNVVDLAVGVVIGGAFGKIVTSLVSDILMPLLGRVLGKVNFDNLFVTLSGPVMATLEEAKKAGAVTLNYGIVLNNVINFLIVAGSVYLILRALMKMKLHEEAVAPPTPSEALLTEIRDLLKAGEQGR
jgi:large conductance mechanosensitive channel